MKQIRFTFEKGGVVTADLLEEEAPLSCKAIWDGLEKPLQEKTLCAVSAGMCFFTDYIPNVNNVDLPRENLRHYGQVGDVATISPAEYRELTVKGFLPLYLCFNLRGMGPHMDLHGVAMPQNCDFQQKKQMFRKSCEETLRANIFAKIHEEDWETLFEIGKRHRYYGIENVLIERVEV